MPKEIELEDGTKETVYEQNEVEELKTAAEKAKELEDKFSNLGKDMGVGENETIEQKLAEMKENANPNFAKFRTKFNAMEKELKTAGKEFDESGNIISGAKPITPDEIVKMTNDAVQNALSSNKREEALSKFTIEDRKVVEHYLDKLMATGGTLHENMDLAIAKAFPDRDINAMKSNFQNLGGSSPIPQINKTTKFTDTDEGKSLLNDLVPTKK